jgi:hypothetical protein
MLLWRIASDILPTRENLSKFNNEMDIVCPLCGYEKETTLHTSRKPVRCTENKLKLNLKNY